MNKFFLYLTVFLTGLTITAVELTVSHLVAPYFGTSLIVWTNVIGVILAGLALGYYAGGKIADKFPTPKYLYLIILISGIFLIAVPFIINPLSKYVTLNPFTGFDTSTLTIFILSFFIIILLFFPPITLLATTSPYLIRLAACDQKTIGEVSGKIFAIGTIGSIIGTFLPAFLFIPYIGSKETILFFGLLMIVLGSFGALKNKLKFASSAILILPFSLTNLGPVKNNPNEIYETETPYQYIQVLQKDDDKFLIFNEGSGIQTVSRKNLLTNFYYDYFAPLPYLLPRQNNLDIMIAGLGAGTINNQYDYFFKDKYNLKIDGVELDPKVTELAQKYFDLKTSNTTLHNQDARYFLNKTQKKYDIIVIDAYKQYYLPEHLVTKEFFQEVNNRLNQNGILALNLVSISTDEKLFQAINNTISKSFKNVYFLNVPGSYNYLVCASNQEINFDKLKKINNKKLKDVISYFQNIKKYQTTSEQIFTDNKSPVNLMTDLMLLQELK